MAIVGEEYLTDEHIFRLSEKMGSERDVRNLGLKVLKLSQPDIQSALTDTQKTSNLQPMKFCKNGSTNETVDNKL